MVTESTPIHIDGSHGEGGGQMLRTALAMSMVTGKPLVMQNIRAGRKKPGLMRQHLTCVQAAAAMSSAKVTGASVGSMAITFAPGPVKAGRYHFPIGTAGSTMMVLQAILPALLGVDGDSMVIVEGGTHNTSAPSFEFVEQALVPPMNRAGAGVSLRLERYGFYPAGGGRVVVEVSGVRAPKRLEILERGARIGASASALVSRLARSIALRELEVLQQRLSLSETDLHVVEVKDAIGPGNAASVALRYEHITEVIAAVGEIGKSAESVALEIVHLARGYIASMKPVGEYLADQLMVPLAVLAGGRFATGPLSEHARTNMAVIGAFGGDVRVDEAGVVSVAAIARAGGGSAR